MPRCRVACHGGGCPLTGKAGVQACNGALDRARRDGLGAEGLEHASARACDHPLHPGESRAMLRPGTGARGAQAHRGRRRAAGVPGRPAAMRGAAGCGRRVTATTCDMAGAVGADPRRAARVAGPEWYRAGHPAQRRVRPLRCASCRRPRVRAGAIRCMRACVRALDCVFMCLRVQLSDVVLPDALAVGRGIAVPHTHAHSYADAHADRFFCFLLLRRLLLRLSPSLSLSPLP